MGKSKKVATGATVATGKVMSLSGEQYIRLQYHDEELTGTSEVRLHATLESALRESQTRIQNL